MPHYHAVVWIDHQKGAAWQFSPTEQQNTVVHAHGRHHVHSHKSTHASAEEREFFDGIAQALEGAREILPVSRQPLRAHIRRPASLRLARAPSGKYHPRSAPKASRPLWRHAQKIMRAPATRLTRRHP